jgi:hypothetical protein
LWIIVRELEKSVIVANWYELNSKAFSRRIVTAAQNNIDLVII